MDLSALKVFLVVANEKSFSRAATKLHRTQPAVSLAVQRLESALDERLVDRSGKEMVLTDAGQTVLEFARRFDNLEKGLEVALAELRDRSAGRLVVGANESTALYLLKHVRDYRRLYPKVRVEVRRSLSSQVPHLVIDGDLELGVISFDPVDTRLESEVIYKDRLCFVVSPEHRVAGRDRIRIGELGMETFIAHNVQSPYRQAVIRTFQKHHVMLNMDVEMPTVEAIRRMVQENEGVAFLPKMCVEQDLEQGTLVEVSVDELKFDRHIRLVYPANRTLSHAGRALLDLVRRPALVG